MRDSTFCKVYSSEGTCVSGLRLGSGRYFPRRCTGAFRAFVLALAGIFHAVVQVRFGPSSWLWLVFSTPLYRCVSGLRLGSGRYFPRRCTGAFRAFVLALAGIFHAVVQVRFGPSSWLWPVFSTPLYSAFRAFVLALAGIFHAVVQCVSGLRLGSGWYFPRRCTGAFRAFVLALAGIFHAVVQCVSGLRLGSGWYFPRRCTGAFRAFVLALAGIFHAVVQVRFGPSSWLWPVFSTPLYRCVSGLRLGSGWYFPRCCTGAFRAFVLALAGIFHAVVQVRFGPSSWLWLVFSTPLYRCVSGLRLGSGRYFPRRCTGAFRAFVLALAGIFHAVVQVRFGPSSWLWPVFSTPLYRCVSGLRLGSGWYFPRRCTGAFRAFVLALAGIFHAVVQVRFGPSSWLWPVFSTPPLYRTQMG